MAKLSDRKFHITNSPFPRFSALVDKVRKRGKERGTNVKREKREKRKHRGSY
jgi:hypothetical protein